jgi:murein L,D-transpeptidase YcbB/YkuD
MNKLYLSILLIAITCCQKATKGIVSIDNASFFDLNLLEDKIKIDSVALNNTENKLLIDFYKKNNYEIIWQSENHRNFVLQEIGNAENEGLNPIDYWYN